MALNIEFNNLKNVDIFIYSHIPFKPITSSHIYKVLTNSHEDASKFNTDLAIYRDYNGLNISNENLMYNEYCGFYWLWKNYPLKKYIGLNHYRRYYTCCNDLIDIDKCFEKGCSIILNERIPLIIPKYLNMGGKTLTNREWYAYWHNVEDFDLLEKIIKDKYPKYAGGFDKMSNATFLHGCNMFTMRKETFEEYCGFVFSVLKDFRKERGFFEIKDCINYVINHKEQYIKEGLTYYNVEKQSRIVGYLAERVLGTFLWSGRENSLMKNSLELKWFMVQEKDYKI
jgi:hypothetical protein